MAESRSWRVTPADEAFRHRDERVVRQDPVEAGARKTSYTDLLYRRSSMFDDYNHIARIHVCGKCVAIDLTWSEVEEMIDGREVIEEHVFNGLAVIQIRLLIDWREPLHIVYPVHHDRKLVVYRTIYIPTLDQWEPPVPPQEEMTMADHDAFYSTNCGGEAVLVSRPHAVEQGGKLTVVRGVPMYECDACGETYLTTAVMKQLDALVADLTGGRADEAIVRFSAAA